MTSLYDPYIYDQIFEPEPFASWYASLVDDSSKPVVELACGTGQVIAGMGNSGLDLTGIDIDPGMVEAARARLPNANFIEGDMRSFEVQEKAGLIFIARNSLLHLHAQEDYARMFSCVRESLVTDGILAFDIFNPDLNLLANGQAEELVFSGVEHPEHGSTNVYSETEYDRARQIVSSDWFLGISEGERQSLGRLELKIIFPQELLTILSSNGFELIDRWGSFEREPFESDSRRQICITKPV